MHHARRSLRVKRSGARNSSGSARPAPSATGKWALPQNPGQSHVGSSSPQTLPGLNKWAAPQPPNAGSSPAPSGLSKWARPQPPSNANPEQPAPSGMSKWARPAAPQSGSPNAGSSSNAAYTARSPSTSAAPSVSPSSFGKWARPSPPPAASQSSYRNSEASNGSSRTAQTSWAAPRKQEQPQRAAPSWAAPSAASTGKGQPQAPRPQANSAFKRDPPPATSAFRRDPPPATSTSTANTAASAPPRSGFARDAAPHVTGATEPPPDTAAQDQPASAPSVPQPSENLQEAAALEVPDAGDEAATTRSRRPAPRQFERSKGKEPVYKRDQEEAARLAAEKEKQKIVKPRSLRLKKVQADVYIPSLVSVGNLARLLNVRLDYLQRRMKRMGMEEQSSYDYMLTAEYASLVALEFNRNPVINDEAAFDIYPPPPAADRDSLPPRPPVVTIMGHVDHGKTTLLDTLRSSSVAKGEAGGITQHIGAFSVPVPNPGGEKRTITFLDTPGHAAFSAMRARGASVTDIVVLVVAADDGIMPQTREVLELVKKDSNKVGLVVAINKVDKPGVDVSKIETALLAEGVQLETFGGDVPVVHVSGLTGQGLPTLVETISLVAEMQDLRAEQKGPVHGYVLESRVDKGLGPTATVLVLRGELTPGMGLISGLAHGKVRLLKSPAGQSLKAVGPGTAALVSGWKELPKAGDEVLTGTDGEIKKALANRGRKADLEATIQDAEAINESRRVERELAQAEAAGAAPAPARSADSGKNELRLVVKGDVSGTVEAVCGAVVGIGNHIAGVKVVAQGVGEVSESDVMRAKAVEGIVVAFSVNIPRPVKAMAASQGVKILESNIIYALMDEVKKNVIELLPTSIEKRVTGEANVLQIFEIQLKAKQTMKVAGCRVTNGIVEKNKKARVVRNGEVVFEGSLETLKHLKRDIMEAGKGLECGMAFDGWDDLREGDLIQMYQEIVKPGQL